MIGARKGNSSMKGSSMGSINSVNEASDIDWWTHSYGSQYSSQPEEDMHFCMSSESKVQSQRCMVHQIRRCRERMDTRKVQERPEKAPSRRRSQHPTKIWPSAFKRTSEKKTKQELMYVFDKSDNRKWVREEAVDGGAVECVTSKKRLPHLRVKSRRGEGGNDADQCGQTPRKRSCSDPHEEQATYREPEDRRGHAAEERQRHVHS